MSRLPTAITDYILTFCNTIVPGGVPIFIGITPDRDSRPLDCFMNVRHAVEKQGGRIQYGWAIWEWRGVFVEAEHHAVHDLGNNQPWRDITPCRGYQSRLFLPDDSATYNFDNEGVLRLNKMQPLNDDYIIADFIDAECRKREYLNTLPGVGVITAAAVELKQLNKLTNRAKKLYAAVATKYGDL